MELMTTLAATVTAARHLRDLAKEDEPSFEEMRSSIDSLHDGLLDLKGDVLEAAERRRELEDEIRRLKVVAPYERRKIGHAVVLVLPRAAEGGEDGPPCCPKCLDSKGEPLPLQISGSIRRRDGSHVCTACNGAFHLEF